MSELLRERNDLDAARQHLRRSSELGEHAGLPQNRYRWRVAMARIRQAEGDLDGALDAARRGGARLRRRLLPERAAGRRRCGRGSGSRRGGSATRSPGRASAASSADDELSYLREFEHITLARVLLAQHAIDRDERPSSQATGLLERLLQAAEDGERTGSVIEILVLQALAHQTRRRHRRPRWRRSDARWRWPSRRATSGSSSTRAPPMAALLRAAAKQGVAPRYVRRLLAAVGTARRTAHAGQQGLVEPLSERELDVLRLLGTDLDGPDIARELVVSLNTVRTHTKNIYAKLGVNNRRAAVRRAAELDLLSRTPRR